MATTQAPKESVLQSKVTQYLRTVPGLWYMKVHGSEYQRPGIPDIIGFVKGKPFALELKRDYSEKPTPIQEYEMERMQRCGARVIVCRSVAEACAFIDDLVGPTA